MVINENILMSMKGLSKLDAKEVRHYDIAKEMIEKLQCLYGKDCNVAQEKAEEPFNSNSEPKHVAIGDKKKKNKKEKEYKWKNAQNI